MGSEYEGSGSETRGFPREQGESGEAFYVNEAAGTPGAQHPTEQEREPLTARGLRQAIREIVREDDVPPHIVREVLRATQEE